MTDTLKPAELDLEALKKVALEATPGAYVALSAPPGWEPPADVCEFGVVSEPLHREVCRAWERSEAVFFATFDPPTVLSLLTRIEALEAERDEARAGLAYVLDRAVYGDSYGVYGSDFQCCHFCQGGGAPGVAMEHDADCPVSRYPRAVTDWFEEMEAERQDREAAEAQRDRMREALETAQRIIDDTRKDIHGERVADWYPEGAHNAAASMSEAMRLIGNSLADVDLAALSQGTAGSSGAGE